VEKDFLANKLKSLQRRRSAGSGVFINRAAGGGSTGVASKINGTADRGGILLKAEKVQWFLTCWCIERWCDVPERAKENPPLDGSWFL